MDVDDSVDLHIFLVMDTHLLFCLPGGDGSRKTLRLESTSSAQIEFSEYGHFSNKRNQGFLFEPALLGLAQGND